jgi:hypothetical protein
MSDEYMIANISPLHTSETKNVSKFEKKREDSKQQAILCVEADFDVARADRVASNS